MIIKYRSGVTHSKRNAKCMSIISKNFGRPIVHVRRFFTFKQTVSNWPPTIYVNKPRQMINITGKNDIRTSADYHSGFKNPSLGMINIF
jgi:hypothetical protein